MRRVTARLRRQIVQRADGRCEYCRLAQEGQEATFHVDHVTPVTAGGLTHRENLVLACVSCSLRKAARVLVIDPVTGVEVTLYHPRRDDWSGHFKWDGEMVIGLTPVGRATVEALALNRPLAVAIRREEMAFGRHPPPVGKS